MDQVRLSSFNPAETIWRGPVFDVRSPRKHKMPVVFASPHSGRDYPPNFLAASRLDAVTIRRSEDCYVDELYKDVPDQGAPLIRAHFPRAYLDVNREPFELDPAMFVGKLPGYVNTRSLRVAGGLGTIARVVADGKEIYADKLSFEDAQQRVSELYEPYHDQLRELVADAHHRFGCAVLIDCHSMPSVGGPTDQDAGLVRADVVLGDRHGTSCDASVTDFVEAAFTDLGYSVYRNTPYAGGYTTERYGKPLHGIHTLQIELSRAIYMDEDTLEKKPGFKQVQADLGKVVARLVDLEIAPLSPLL